MRNLNRDWIKSDTFKKLSQDITKKMKSGLQPLPSSLQTFPTSHVTQNSFHYVVDSAIQCDYYNKNIDRNREISYTIRKNPEWDGRNGSTKQQKMLTYHAECFREVAGEEFT